MKKHNLLLTGLILFNTSYVSAADNNQAIIFAIISLAQLTQKVAEIAIIPLSTENKVNNVLTTTNHNELQAPVAITELSFLKKDTPKSKKINLPKSHLVQLAHTNNFTKYHPTRIGKTASRQNFNFKK